MWRKIKNHIWRWRSVLIVTPSTTAMVIGLRFAGLLQSLELGALDQFFLWQVPEPVDERIVIVEINEKDVQKYNWPISDAKLAELLSAIKQQQPRVIGLDIYRDLPIEPGQKELVKLFESTPNLIAIQKIAGNSKDYNVNPPSKLNKLGQVAANNFILDADGRIRRNLLSLEDNNGETIYALAVRLALDYLKAENIYLEVVNPDSGEIKLGKATFLPFKENDGGYMRPTMGGYLTLANFRNFKKGFLTVSIADILEGRRSKNLFRDRVVLIGVTAESIPDYFYTSRSGGFLSQYAKKFSGVSIHADVTSQIISAAIDDRQQIRVWSESKEWLWILALSFLGAACTWIPRYQQQPQKLPFTSISISMLAFAIVSGSYISLLQGLWIPVVPGLMALFGSTGIVTIHIARSTSNLRKTFGRYLTDEVVANLLETPEGLKLGGEKRIVTLLISDLRGFSAFSEKISPETVVEVMNLYLEAMTDVVNKYKGTINDFMGDGIFIIFGAPVEREDDPTRAIACALAMQLEMENFNQKLAKMNLSPLGMGIGMHTGEVFAGNIGSQQRAKYTVMGSNVNLASRIESYTVGGQILASENTIKVVTDTLRIDGEMQVQAKGIKEPINIYDIGGISGKYNFSLAAKAENMRTLIEEIPVSFKIVEGKHLLAEVFYGSIVKLSTTDAEFHSKQPIQIFSNIQINFLDEDASLKDITEVYAKVIKILDEHQTKFYAHFTSVPKNFELFVNRQESI